MSDNIFSRLVGGYGVQVEKERERDLSTMHLLPLFIYYLLALPTNARIYVCVCVFWEDLYEIRVG